MAPKQAKKSSAKKSSAKPAANKNWEAGLVKAELEEVCGKVFGLTLFYFIEQLTH